jgi:hypothetical protein
MSASLNFLLQATKLLHNRNYDDHELTIIYEYLISVDNEILNDYYNKCTVLTFTNDLELYIEIVNSMIVIFEEKEEYERCGVLKSKMDESLIIIDSHQEKK